MIKDFLFNTYLKIKYGKDSPIEEFCTRCQASLPMQKGYSSDLPYWVCKGCGEMLINPTVEEEDDIVWMCDGCGDVMNLQPGFSRDCGEFACTSCGFTNKIADSEIYASENEFQASLNNPYKGLSDEDVLELSLYEEVQTLGNKDNVIAVRNTEDDKLYVKKYLKDYDLSVYQYLLEHPVEFMPKLIALYEGSNNLVVIEEFIEGPTLERILEVGTFEELPAVSYIIDLCMILLNLQNMDRPIVHRDIKPSNIVITMDQDIYLLDMNVAKWYKPDEKEDTKLFASQYYAAPEQFGYGFSASSEKTDVYALGVILNEMITGKLPKEQKAKGPVWNIIEKCISLDPENRYTVVELLIALRELTKD